LQDGERIEMKLFFVQESICAKYQG